MADKKEETQEIGKLSFFPSTSSTSSYFVDVGELVLDKLDPANATRKMYKNLHSQLENSSKHQLTDNINCC